jgi:hypothetical protein
MTETQCHQSPAAAKETLAYAPCFRKSWDGIALLLMHCLLACRKTAAHRKVCLA